MLAYAIYTGLKCLKQYSISWREAIINVIFIALILWTKFTILGFYTGWVLFPGQPFPEVSGDQRNWQHDRRPSDRFSADNRSGVCLLLETGNAEESVRGLFL